MIDIQKARKILRSCWEKITPETTNFVDDERLVNAIRRIIGSETKSYRYALPTQLLAKSANPLIDSRCMQKKRGGPGAFDARSFCKKVIVEFNRQNYGVLGKSGDPYVSKPLRHEEISEKYRGAIKDKEGWDDLCLILNEIEKINNSDFTLKVLNQTLLEIYRRLPETKIRYPIPSTISLDQAEALLMKYLSEPSKGVRPQVITYSLFKTAGERLNLFKRVVSSKTTAPEYFDVECYSRDERVELAISVKDMVLTAKEVEDELPKIHERKILAFVVMAFKGVKENEKEELMKLCMRELASGLDIQVVEHPVEFFRPVMFLLGKDGRKEFLKNVSMALDEFAPFEDRKRWAELLAQPF